MGTEILRAHDCLNHRHTPSFRRPHRNPNPNSHPKPFKKRRSRSPGSAKHGCSLDLGRVMILKRGQPLDSSSDPRVSGTGRLGADPEKFRIVAYAGSAFSTSPSPRSLPLPTFSRRRGEEEEGSVVDHSATKDLRRLLRLEWFAIFGFVGKRWSNWFGDLKGATWKKKKNVGYWNIELFVYRSE